MSVPAPLWTAWELLNEPRMKAAWVPAGAPRTLPLWVDEMARHVKVPLINSNILSIL